MASLLNPKFEVILTGAAIAEGHGDLALLLLKEGADSGKKDVDDRLALSLAPDDKVCQSSDPLRM